MSTFEILVNINGTVYMFKIKFIKKYLEKKKEKKNLLTKRIFNIIFWQTFLMDLIANVQFN